MFRKIDFDQFSFSDLQVFGWPHPPRSPPQEEPSQGELDRAVPSQAQEGSGGGDLKEEDQENHQVPEGRRWSHPSRHHG